MSETSNSSFEKKLADRAARFAYPPTPDLLRRLEEQSLKQPRPFPMRNWALGLAVLLVLCLGAFSVPAVRAAVENWIDMGAIRIFFGLPSGEGAPSGEEPAPTPLPSLLDLDGRTTLEQARERVDFPILLPAGMPPPDYVFVQFREGHTVLMVWAEGEDITLSLMLLGPGAFAGKQAPMILERVEVKGRPALWLEGEHALFLRRGGDWENVWLFVESNVLIWERGPVTYRLEGNFSQEDAIAIGESLVEFPAR